MQVCNAMCFSSPRCESHDFNALGGTNTSDLCSSQRILVAPYRAILRYYRCDTPYRAILLREFRSPPKWCDTLPWYLVLHRHICAIPSSATYRAIIVRYPIKKQERKRFVSLKVSRDMKSIAAGPLSKESFKAIFWKEPHKAKNNRKEGKDPHPQDFNLTKKTACFTKGQVRPY